MKLYNDYESNKQIATVYPSVMAYTPSVVAFTYSATPSLTHSATPAVTPSVAAFIPSVAASEPSATTTTYGCADGICWICKDGKTIYYPCTDTHLHKVSRQVSNLVDGYSSSDDGYLSSDGNGDDLFR